MPITYDFPFNRATELNSRPLKQTRYNFTIDNTVDDPWDSRFIITNPQNPPYIPNHPIDIRLMSPKVVSTATWELAAPSLVHSNSAPDTLPTSLAPIPNPMAVVNSVLNIDSLVDIDSISTNETSGIDSGDGGMQMFPTGIASNLSLPNPATGAANSLNITNLVSVYSNQIRNLGNSAGLTLVMMVMGSNQAGVGPMAPGNTVNESNYITGPASFGANPFNQEFYKTSSYFAFNSADSAIPATRSMNVSLTNTSAEGFCTLRRNFGTKKLGLTMSSQSLQSITHRSAIVGGNRATTFKVNSSIGESVTNFLSGFSNGEYIGLIPINRRNSEILLADRPLGNPLQIYCEGNRIGTEDGSNAFESVSATGVTFTILTANAFGLFSSDATDVTPYTADFTVRASGISDSFGAVFTAQTNSPVVFRAETSPSFGNRSFIEIKYKQGNPKRLFRSGNNNNNLGITAGSYIRLTGTPATFNGVYQVVGVFDGVPDDSVTTRDDVDSAFLDNGQLYQYVEVVPQIPSTGNFNGTIQNITDILPVLHIKYREP